MNVGVKIMNPCSNSPGNVFVNLDRPLPKRLKLIQGQNVAIVRDVSEAGEYIVRSLQMSSPIHQADKVSYGLHLPGQPEATFIVGLGAALEAGSGEITIQLGSPGNKLIRIPFVVLAAKD